MTRASDSEGSLSELEQRLRGRIAQEILYELQTGGGLTLPGDTGASCEPQIRSLAARLVDLRALFGAAPARVVRWLGGPKLRILDMGAGRSPWSMAFARAWPDVRVVALDLPDELPAVIETVNAAGLADQYEFVAADVFNHQWAPDREFDLILVANVCHLFNANKNQALLGCLAPLLAPGGALTIIEQLLEEQPDWHRWAALYALGVNHHAPGGGLFTAPTYFAWLRACGLLEPWGRGLSPVPPLSCVTAYRDPPPTVERTPGKPWSSPLNP